MRLRLEQNGKISKRFVLNWTTRTSSLSMVSTPSTTRIASATWPIKLRPAAKCVLSKKNVRAARDEAVCFTRDARSSTLFKTRCRAVRPHSPRAPSLRRCRRDLRSTQRTGGFFPLQVREHPVQVVAAFRSIGLAIRIDFTQDFVIVPRLPGRRVPLECRSSSFGSHVL
jgi:hypothetical protein